MNRIRRLASIAVTAVLSLAVFSPAPAPARAESENAGELGAVIFAFDFSRSIYCSYDGAPPTCSEIGPDLAAAVSGLADDIAANSVAYSERKVTFEVEIGRAHV